MPESSRSVKKWAAVLLGVLVVLVAGVTLLARSAASSSTAGLARIGRVLPTELTGVEPAAADPSSAECDDSMDDVRDQVFTRYESGLVLDREGSEVLTQALEEVDETCGLDQGGRFRATELTPWLNHQASTP
jgi:hypothetical protein